MNNLINEIVRGEHTMDKITESSYDFSGAAQAEYFSKARENMESDVGHCIMHDNQQLGELKILKRIFKNKRG